MMKELYRKINEDIKYFTIWRLVVRPFKSKKRSIGAAHLSGLVFDGAGLPNQRGTTRFSSWSYDLAKLNPKCHMNYL